MNESTARLLIDKVNESTIRNHVAPQQSAVSLDVSGSAVPHNIGGLIVIQSTIGLACKQCSITELCASLVGAGALGALLWGRDVKVDWDRVLIVKVDESTTRTVLGEVNESTIRTLLTK